MKWQQAQAQLPSCWCLFDWDNSLACNLISYVSNRLHSKWRQAKDVDFVILSSPRNEVESARIVDFSSWIHRRLIREWWELNSRYKLTIGKLEERHGVRTLVDSRQQSNIDPRVLLICSTKVCAHRIGVFILLMHVVLDSHSLGWLFAKNFKSKEHKSSTLLSSKQKKNNNVDSHSFLPWEGGRGGEAVSSENEREKRKGNICLTCFAMLKMERRKTDGFAEEKNWID